MDNFLCPLHNSGSSVRFILSYFLLVDDGLPPEDEE